MKVCSWMVSFTMVLVVAAPFSAQSRSNEMVNNKIAIKKLLLQVRETNPHIQSVKANVDAAFAHAAAAKQPLYNPEVEFDGERIYADKNVDTYTVGLNQTVDLFNKRTERYKTGLSEAKEAQAQLALSQLKLGTTLLNALAEYNTALEVVNLSERRTQILKSFVKLTKEKYHVGDLDQASLDQSHLSLSESIASLFEAKENLNRAEVILLSIVEPGTHVWPLLPKKLPNPPHLPKDITDMLSQHPSILVQNHRVITARNKINVAKKNMYPDPTVGFRGGQDDNELLLGFNITIPLFVRNTYRAEVNMARDQATAVDKTRTNTYWHMGAQLKSSAMRYKLFYDGYYQWEKASKKSLSEGVRLLDKFWKAGEINTTDYLIQIKTRLDSQIAGVVLRGQAWQSWFEWLEASNNLDNWINTTT